MIFFLKVLSESLGQGAIFLTKTNKSNSDVLGWTPPSKPTKLFMALDIENSHTEPRADIRAWPMKRSSKHPTKSCLLQNSLSCPEAFHGGGCRQKSPLDSATDIQEAQKHL